MVDEKKCTALHYAARYQCILFNNYDTIANNKNTCVGLLSKVKSACNVLVMKYACLSFCLSINCLIFTFQCGEN